MIDLIRETLSLHNLPVTLLLGLVVLYWLLVIVGIFDADMDGDGGGDLGDASDGHHGSGGAGMGDGGGRAGRSGWFNFSDVPLSIVGSFLALFMWVFSVLGNYYFNGTVGDRSQLFAVGLLIPNGVVSILLTRIAIIPFQKLFRAMQNASTEAEAVVGREAKVISVRVDERYGQVEVITRSSPLLVNARVEAGADPLERGTQVIITTEAEDGKFYFVRPISITDVTLSTNNNTL